MMREFTVADYMTPSVRTIGRMDTLANAHQVMRDNHVRHLPVVEGGRVVGIVSQRDLYLLETIKGIDTEDSLVEDAMTANPYVVAPSTPLAQVVMEMIDHRWGSAIVAEGAKVRGIFTAIDAMKALVEALPAPRRKPGRAQKGTRRA